MQVLRTLFFLLVLGNLLLFAWGQGYFGAAGGSGEAERLAGQIEPDKLRIVGKGTVPKPAESAQEQCRTVTGLAHDMAGKLAELLTGRDGQLKVVQRSLAEPVSWWVHIPPLQNAIQADRKAAELGKLGIRDFYVVRESGSSQYAISLGLFKNERSAKDYLDVLQKKNVKTARILVREATGEKVVVEVRGTAERLTKALSDLPTEYFAAAAGECSAEKP